MKYIVCVATQSRFAQASVLRQSCEEHMPSHEFLLKEIQEIPGESIYKTVSRARIETCLDLFSTGATEVIHMGADWLVLKPLLLDIPDITYEALFVPHVIEFLPSALDKRVEMMRAGVINSDFQVWRNTRQVKAFLEQVLDFLRSGKHTRDIFEYEQTWLPFALSTLYAHLILYPGYGMAFYNLHERSLDEDLFVITDSHPGDQLRVFHFSGFDVNKPGLSVHGEPRVLNNTEKDLLESYRAEVKACSL